MLRSLVERFGLTTLIPLLEVCETLAGSADAPLDVAVFGQFKSGKSSLLNAVLGSDVLPAGVLPLTTVVTRVTAGSQPAARITRQDGTTADIELASIADYVSESRNPDNRQGIAVVDVFTPALADLPGLRLVDTPGLGSIFAHNTQSTRDWLPNVAIALVAVSAERPLSDEDRRLIAELRPHTPRIALVLTKLDLLTEPQRDEVRAFLSEQLAKGGGADLPILMFSTREQPQQWVTRLKDDLLHPVAVDTQCECERTLAHKRNSLTKACHDRVARPESAKGVADVNVREIASHGIELTDNHRVLRLGKRDWLTALGAALPADPSHEGPLVWLAEFPSSLAPQPSPLSSAACCSPISRAPRRGA